MASSTRAAAPNLRTCYDRFARHFGSAEDYRRQGSVHHRLTDILFITLCASIAGADDLSAVAEFAKTNEPWFSAQLDLGQGVSSESTFRTVFMLLDGEELVKYFVPWV